MRLYLAATLAVALILLGSNADGLSATKSRDESSKDSRNQVQTKISDAINKVRESIANKRSGGFDFSNRAGNSSAEATGKSAKKSAGKASGGSAKKSAGKVSGGSAKKSAGKASGGSAKKSAGKASGGSAKGGAVRVSGGSAKKSAGKVSGGSAKKSAGKVSGGSAKKSAGKVSGGSAKKSAGKVSGGSAKKSAGKVSGGSAKKSAGKVSGGSAKKSAGKVSGGSAKKSAGKVSGGSAKKSAGKVSGGSAKKSAGKVSGGSAKKSAGKVSGGSAKKSAGKVSGGSAKKSAGKVSGGSAKKSAGKVSGGSAKKSGGKVSGGSAKKSAVRVSGGSAKKSGGKASGGSAKKSAGKVSGGSAKKSGGKVSGGSAKKSAVRVSGGSAKKSAGKVSGGSAKKSGGKVSGGSAKKSAVRVSGGSAKKSGGKASGGSAKKSAGKVSGGSAKKSAGKVSGGSAKKSAGKVSGGSAKKSAGKVSGGSAKKSAGKVSGGSAKKSGGKASGGSAKKSAGKVSGGSGKKSGGKASGGSAKKSGGKASGGSAKKSAGKASGGSGKGSAGKAGKSSGKTGGSKGSQDKSGGSTLSGTCAQGANFVLEDDCNTLVNCKDNSRAGFQCPENSECRRNRCRCRRGFKGKNDGRIPGSETDCEKSAGGSPSKGKSGKEGERGSKGGSKSGKGKSGLQRSGGKGGSKSGRGKSGLGLERSGDKGGSKSGKGKSGLQRSGGKGGSKSGKGKSGLQRSGGKGGSKSGKGKSGLERSGGKGGSKSGKGKSGLQRSGGKGGSKSGKGKSGLQRSGGKGGSKSGKGKSGLQRSGGKGGSKSGKGKSGLQRSGGKGGSKSGKGKSGLQRSGGKGGSKSGKGKSGLQRSGGKGGSKSGKGKSGLERSGGKGGSKSGKGKSGLQRSGGKGGSKSGKGKSGLQRSGGKGGSKSGKGKSGLQRSGGKGGSKSGKGKSGLQRSGGKGGSKSGKGKSGLQRSGGKGGSKSGRGKSGLGLERSGGKGGSKSGKGKSRSRKSKSREGKGSKDKSGSGWSGKSGIPESSLLRNPSDCRAQDAEFELDDDCQTMYRCKKGKRVRIVRKNFKCPQNTVCEANVCKCNEGFEGKKDRRFIGGDKACSKPGEQDPECAEQKNGKRWLENNCGDMFYCKNGQKFKLTFWTGCRGNSQCKDNKCQCPPGQEAKKKDSVTGDEYCLPSKKPPSGKPTRVSCDKGRNFQQVGLRCVRVSPKKDTFQNAEANCRNRGAKLLNLKNLISDPNDVLQGMKGNAGLKKHCEGEYWLRGVEALNDMDLFLGEAVGGLMDAINSELALTATKRLERLQLGALLGEKYTAVTSACRELLAGQRSNVNINACPEFKDKCLVFTPNGLKKIGFRSCKERLQYICEDSPDADADEDWEYTDFISIDTPGATGDHEDRTKVVRELAKKGKCLCKRPLGIRARIKGTQTLLSNENPQGFKFSLSPRKGFKCLNKDQAGKSCPDVEVAYACPVEKDTCEQDNNKAKCEAQNRDCVNRCGGGHYCRRRARSPTRDVNKGRCCIGANEDMCVDTGVCSASGDPHYKTFDGIQIDYMGPCTYTLTENLQAVDGCPVFMVEAENRPKPGSTATWLKTIILKYNNHKVELLQGKAVRVDGTDLNLPYDADDGSFSMKKLGTGTLDFMELKTDFCLTIKWDGDRKVNIQAPDTCKARVRGICGNWNGNAADDWTKKTGTLVDLTQNQRQKSMELGDSWRVPNAASTLESCVARVLRDCSAEENRKYGAINACGILTSASGPFAPVLGNPDVKKYLEESQHNCMVDMCNSEEPELCSAVSKVADEMHTAFGLTVDEAWRDMVTGCPARCGANMTYDQQMTECQPTCDSDPEDDENPPSACPNPDTRPGCRCNNGLVLSVDKCVTRDQCGCQTPEGYLLPGQDIVDRTCETRYKCVRGEDGVASTVTEANGSCDQHATCDARKCVCNDGYDGDGKTCRAKPVTCPRGWTKQGSMCYRVKYNKMTWMQAQKECGCESGGMAQLCAAHTPEQLTFLKEYYNQKKIKNGLWVAGNTIAQTKSYNVIMQTTPSRLLAEPEEAGCHNMIRGFNGNLSPQVDKCEARRGYCCMMDPNANRDIPKVWTPKVVPWKTPNGGRAFTPNQAVRRNLLMCPDPFDLECMTADGRAWNQTGQTAMCNPLRGFICKGTECSDYRVRGLCLKDVNECEVLGSNACSGGQECINCIGGFDCRCPGKTKRNSRNQCESTHPGCGQCIASGDPHYTTLFGKRFDWQGRCKYVLTETCPRKMSAELPFPCFRIVVKNTPCGTTEKKVTCTFYVEVHIFRKCIDMSLPNSERTMVRMDRDGTYTYAGQSKRKAPLVTADFAVQYNPSTKMVELSTPWGLKVVYKGSKAYVDVPRETMGHMCGLCGDCATPEGFEMRDGSVLPIVMKGAKIDPEFIANVALDYEEPDPSEESCEAPNPEEEPECTEAQNAIITDNRHCGFFKDARFDGCRGRADMDYLGCVEDLCAVIDTPEFEETTCRRIAEMVEGCRQDMGPDSPQIVWRSANFCAKDCAANETFTDNAALEEMCFETENNDNAAIQPVEGCICQSGFKRDPLSMQCVEPDMCGCYVTYQMPPPSTEQISFYVPRGDVVSKDADCNQARCEGGQMVDLPDKKLSPNGICDITKKPPEARCRAGYEGDGFTCTPTLECEDGWVDVNRKCTYFSSDPLPWTLAAAKCAEMDGVLATCESTSQCEAFEEALKDSSNAYWARGVVQMNAADGYTSLLVAKGLSATLSGANNYYIPNIPADLSPLLDGDFPAGTRLCYAARYNVDNLMFQLVPCTRALNFACTKRDPSEPKEFTEFCNSDNAASGSQVETTAAMNEADCKICRVPMGVECQAVDPANRDKTQVDRCGGMGETVYACDRADQVGLQPCFAKEVRGKCFPGLDECTTGLHDCGNHSQCVDEFYGFRCVCLGDNVINVNGECVETERCSVKKNPVGGLTLTTVSGSPLNYETRCKFSMASSCGSQGVEDSDRPNFKLDIQSVMNPLNPADFTNIIATIQLSLKGEEATVVIDRASSNVGKITVNGQEYSLPYNGLSQTMGVRVRDTPDMGVVLWRPNDQDLKIDVCLRAGCVDSVSVRTAGVYMDGCGVCGVDEDQAGASATDILEAEKTEDSEVSCVPPATPPPPPPTPPPIAPTPPPTTDTPPPNVRITPETPPPLPPAPECSERFGQECSIVANPQMPFAVCTDLASLQSQCVALRCDGDDMCDVLNKLLRHASCSISSMTPAQQDFMMDETNCEVDVADDCERDYGGDNQCGILRLASGPFSSCGLDNEAYMVCLTRSCTQPKAEMCKYLKEVASGCAAMTDVQKRNFMQQTGCVDNCGPGMRFSFSIRNFAPTCEDPYELDPTGDSSKMGCVCDVGYLMSGGRCIPRSECGCRVGDEYKERGAEWMSDDCTKRYRCDGSDNLSTFDESCGENAECDGAGRCECAEGTMGDCCSPVEDRGNMTCYLACDGITTICNCKMGYSSACGTCVDHNECLTGKHSCENNERCVNLPGDYECQCAPGFERDPYSQKCKDINECANAEEEGVGRCPKGSQCVNREPFYECVCCSGYMQGPNGCIPDPAATEAVLEGPCCRCLGTKCLLVGSFCYTETDGTNIDYTSYSEMYQTRCAQDKPLRAESYSEGTCDEPAPQMTAGPPPEPPAGEEGNPPQGGGPCDQSICSESETKTPPGGAVCLDSTKTTYPNVCELRMATCKKNNNTPPPSLPAYSNGPCPTPTTPPTTPNPNSPLTFTDWGEWSECLHADPSVRCGAIGSHFRERQKSGGSGTPTEDQIRQRASCSLPACPSQPVQPPPGPCADPSVCPKNPRYICATIGVDGRPATFTTPCHFEIAACESGAEGSKIVHDGRCNPGEEKPEILPCEGSVIPEVVRSYLRKDPSTGETCVGEDAVVRECKNSFCDSDDVRVCCRATAFVDVEFRIECSINGTVTSTRTDRYESATKCQCVNRDEADGGR